MKPTRSICIGTVYRDGLLVEMGNLRSRKCLSVNWRGMTSVFQPFQFLEERQLLAAVRGRLAMAGLSLLQWEIKREAGRGDYEPIRCVVGRLHCPHSRAVEINRIWHANKLIGEINKALETMTGAELQEAMASLRKKDVMTLNLPLDFERLPEFWQLKETLRGAWLGRAAAARGVQTGMPAAEAYARADSEIDDVAAVLWIRLWVVLGYLARATNRPGWLNAAGERQLNHACGRKFGEDCPPVGVLTAATVLRKAEPRLGIEDGYMCDLFAMVNPQLAGNFLTKEQRGNLRSLVGRSKNVIAHDAVAQAQLLPRDFFRKRDGTLMQQPEVDRSMIIIISLDRALKLRARLQSTYTQGLVSDAWQVQETTPAEQLTEFYKWLSEVHDHPATPKSAEEILRDFDRLLKVSQACREAA